ncbi:hypothetical protein COLO4_33774 [Corchorus olitorius]|uniref:Uncharacterized protein n=1 Tax=Corchorus olitorius TaxID=93759 RepID=A0A1R3GRM6_9ROSI|nr:hypothetical protein COLO4_33774 [Corchorus olitorius]
MAKPPQLGLMPKPPQLGLVLKDSCRSSRSNTPTTQVAVWRPFTSLCGARRRTYAVATEHRQTEPPSTIPQTPTALGCRPTDSANLVTAAPLSPTSYSCLPTSKSMLEEGSSP